jgi:putative transcriptional regulator
MYATQCLTNQFLVAMPGLVDPNFARTVTYICEHNADGAMGIIVNRPINFHLGEMLDQLEIMVTNFAARKLPIYLGGPVQPDRGFVLHTGESIWNSTLRITPQINITTSKDILEAIACGDGPPQILIALGYAGWAKGQIENELSTNTWLSTPSTSEILFRLPVEQRWRAAGRLIGIDLDLVSLESGHA